MTAGERAVGGGAAVEEEEEEFVVLLKGDGRERMRYALKEGAREAAAGGGGGGAVVAEGMAEGSVSWSGGLGLRTCSTGFRGNCWASGGNRQDSRVCQVVGGSVGVTLL